MKFIRIIFKIAKNLLPMVLNFLFVPVYHLVGLLPRNKNLWIFMGKTGKDYTDNSRVFMEYVVHKTNKIKCVWISNYKEFAKELCSRGLDACYVRSPRFVFLTLRAGKMFAIDALVGFLGFLKNIDNYYLWHGMPLKVINLRVMNRNKPKSQVEDLTQAQKDVRNNLFFDFLVYANENIFIWKNISWANMHCLSPKKTRTVVSSRFFTPIMADVFEIEENKILPVGLPRIDALFYNHREKLIEELRSKYLGCKLILYMPTFRTVQWTKEPFNPFDDRFGFSALALSALLEEKNLVFIYKAHFCDLQCMDSFEKHGRLISISDSDFDELYNFIGQMDILITDYSSIYFDWIVTRKPVVLAPFDFEEYQRSSRELNFDYAQLEGVRANNWGELLEILRSESYFPASEEAVRKFAEFSDGGCCCEKLFDWIEKNG